MKERLEKCSYKPKDGKDCGAHPEQEKAGQDLRRVSERDHGSADTLIPRLSASWTVREEISVVCWQFCGISWPAVWVTLVPLRLCRVPITDFEIVSQVTSWPLTILFFSRLITGRYPFSQRAFPCTPLTLVRVMRHSHSSIECHQKYNNQSD